MWGFRKKEIPTGKTMAGIEDAKVTAFTYLPALSRQLSFSPHFHHYIESNAHHSEISRLLCNFFNKPI